jgi:iron complex outermembrane recepter protein
MAGALALTPLVALSQTKEPTQEVVVTGYAERALLLDTQSRTGSRLGLTVRETPAVVDVLTDVQLLERGARTSVEALNGAPGVTAALLPSSPGTTSMRGFTSGAVSLLYDGVRQSTSGLVGRNPDSWSFERIEVLKGPASVLYGEGALGGAINLVPKVPTAERSLLAGLVSYGTFESIRTAADVNVPLGARSAIRWVSSYGTSDGYIDDSRSESVGSTLSWRWETTDALTVDLAADYYADDYSTSYWGTPLVPLSVARRPSGVVRTENGLVLDKSLRDANFNLTDGVMDAKAWWLRSRAALELRDSWTLTNELSYYDADRRWRNSENYTFNTTSGLLDRGTTRIDHDHRFWSERVILAGAVTLAGMRNRLAAGAEYGRNDFFTPRRFGAAATVDPYGSDARGSFPVGDTAQNFPGAANRVNFDSTLTSSAVFVESGLNVTARWLLIAGLRYERLSLDRTIDDLNAGSRVEFVRDFEPLSWRAGVVFDLTQKSQIFAQYSSAVVPVGSLLLISLANSRFSLTDGESVEVGVKSSFWNARADLTVAAFDIRQNDIITRDPLNSSIAVQGGQQSSRGVELSLSAAVTEALRMDASVSTLDARFDELLEAGGVDRAGKTPPNVPETVASLFATWRLSAMPLSLRIGARHASHFYTNNANTIRVSGYTTLDGAVSWHTSRGELTFRGRNLTDELYAEWTGSSATQALIGAPRTFEISYTARFQP